MRLYYWSCGYEWLNLGDWLTVPLMRALGHTVEVAADGEAVLFGIGTIIGHTQFLPQVKKVVVWGSGCEGGERPLSASPVPVDVRAIRGPVTQEALGLSSDIPMGDPAILVPQLLKLNPKSTGEKLFISHHGSKVIVPRGFDDGVSMRVKEDTGIDLVNRIGGASFVGSVSLHGCILAAAFGVPWALCLPPDWPRKQKSKYDGWFGYMGLDVPAHSAPQSYECARDWWERDGRTGRIRETTPVLDAFPHKGLG